MEADTLTVKVVYPCKPATEAELNFYLQYLVEEYGLAVKVASGFLFKLPSEHISPSSVHTLWIIGSISSICNDTLKGAGLTPGRYVNSDGGWLILIHPKKSEIRTYLNHCSKSLKSLVLYHTALPRLLLPSLPSLNRLQAVNNQELKYIYGLTQSPRLSQLRVESCPQLTILPGLGQLSQLTLLKLSECSSLTQLPGLEQLSQLTLLDLSGCISLTQLPGLEQLSQLTYLCLAGCGIRELPQMSRRMKALHNLDLRNLKLLDLPDWLPEIADEFSLSRYLHFVEEEKAIVYLYNTTVEEIPDMSIFEQPYAIVAKWFEDRRRGNMRTLNEIKVVFLGDGEAGKSHTIARLMNDGGEPDHAVFDGQSTPGIVIRNKEYTVDGRTFQVHYWDFGGQEIMHSMHRIFLTGRTMYVILLNARDDTQSDRAKYWLHNVKSFAPDAPVLLVLNKIDQNENASVDEQDLRNRYGKLTQVVRLSALNFSREEFNRRFTDILLEEIRKTGYLDAQWPIPWTQVKEQLEKMDTHYIMGDRYQAICRACSVDQNQKELLHWFNDLGISFCCCDEQDYALEDYVILRPDWITNALYIILFNRLEGAQNGRIPHSSIYQLLKNAHSDPRIRCTLPGARYTPGDIQYVLGVMRRFSLSFADGSDKEFIPMLCQQNSTVDVQSFRTDMDTLEFNMEFDYLPNNLLHRLMVERHEELDMANVWRTGARFEFPELGYSAVVVIDGNTLRFFIRHSDPMHKPNTYLSMLKANVDRIVKTMGLKAPDDYLIYKVNGKAARFRYDRLLKLYRRGQREEFCEELDEDFPIEDILNQSAPDGLGEELRLLDGIRRSCGSIQDEPSYRLVRNENGSGYANGHNMEDRRNRRIRDDLSKMGFKVGDQSQRGSSGTGKSIGELDLIVFDDRGEPWTIIEALRVSNKRTASWEDHLDKLLNKYNSRGLPRLYLLTYVDAQPEAFERICNDYQEHIKTYDPQRYRCCPNSLAELNLARDAKNIRTVRCSYACGGDPITVYHIFARIPLRNE